MASRKDDRCPVCLHHMMWADGYGWICSKRGGCGSEWEVIELEPSVTTRLEELRAVLRAENISWGELTELQGLASQIDPGDVELLEAAGVPEFPTEGKD